MRRRVRIRLLVLIVFMCGAWSASAHGVEVVERRGGQPELRGSVITIDGNGISIRGESGATQTIPWDRIRDVRLDRSDRDLPRLLETAEQLWRARSRVERGDTTLAEPLFERLFEQYRGQTHETALVVAEGLLRCRLARMDHEAAVIAMLETMRLRRGGVGTDSFSMLPELFDQATGLCMFLPPVWIDERGVHALERSLAAYDPGGDEVVAAVAAQYRRAARQQLGLKTGDADAAPQESNLDHDGAALLVLIADLNHQDRSTEMAARNRLTSQLVQLPAWAQAWVRFALGASMVRDRAIETRLQGVLHLVTVPASDRYREQAYLAGLGLAEAADALEQLGNTGAAESLRGELLSRYPGHPAATGGIRYARNGQ